MLLLGKIFYFSDITVKWISYTRTVQDQVNENICLTFWLRWLNVQIFHSLAALVEIYMKIPKKLVMSESYRKNPF